MITILFSCKSCGLKDHKVLAPSRLTKIMDVAYYVREVLGKAVSDEHKRVSPNCTARTMSDLKIPFDKDDPEGWVGKPKERK